MAAENALMRPMRSDSLKPRPSTQAVWEPRKPAPQTMPQPEPAAQPACEPAEELPAVMEAPAAPVQEEPVVLHEPVQEIEPEPVPEPEPEPLPLLMEETEEEEEEPQPSVPPAAEALFTFAPACSAQPEPPQEEPAGFQPEVMETEDEEPFDLDAVIAAILADDDDEDDEEDHPAAQDALPTEEMPEPAAVPLYEDPKPKPRRKGWFWLIGAALIVAAAGYAARRFGWLN